MSINRLSLILTLTVLLSAPAAGLDSAPDSSRVMTVDDLMGIRNLTEVRISPDGTRVAYVVSVPDLEKNRHDSDVWLVDREGGAALRLTAGLGRDDHPRWSPEGDRIAFLSDRSGATQIWTIAPSGGEAVPLTELKGGAGSFTWSPDGRLLAMLLPDGAAAGDDAPDKPASELIRPGETPRHIHIFLADARDGSCRQLTRGDFSVESFAWSPESGRIVYAARPTIRVPDLFNSDLRIVDIGSGRERDLVARPGPDTSPAWSPDGDRIAFVSTNRRMEWIANWSICLVSAEGGEVRNLTPRFDEFITRCTWSADGGRLFFQANRDVTTQLFALEVESGRIAAVSSGRRVYGGFSFSRDSRTAAFTASEPSRPGEVFISNLDSFRPARLTDINPQLEGIELGPMEVIRWKSPDGTEVEGILLKPVGFEPGRRVPLLTYVHGGPSGKFAYAFSPQIGGGSPIQGETYPLQVLAGHGAAVLMPNPRGSYGYGEKFRMANVGDWGGRDFQDIMSGIDALIERGIADPERLGIMGRSYGGYMTAWSITQTTRFKAASLGAGMCNLVSFFGQTNIPGYMEYYFGEDIWKFGDLYRERSPLTHARRVRTPTLITHGEKDPRVPLPQAREYYHAMKRAGVPVEFVIFPRQGHSFHEPRMQREALLLNLEWFTKRLLDE